MAGVDAWLVVGGRRWARVVAGELCASMPGDTKIKVLAGSTDPELLDWWKISPHKHRIELISELEPCPKSMNGVALVVNSAYQHRSTTQSALSAGYSVVSEKPLAFSQHESTELLELASGLGLNLFAANTFMFADYLSILRSNWLEKGRTAEIEIAWSDAGREVRYGEVKGYDSSVPVIFDVLPHIATIIAATHGMVSLGRSELIVRRGGREVIASFECSGLVIRARISRDAEKRVRLARFTGPAFNVAIDFAVEPGTVSLNGGPAVDVDPAWHTKRKPLAEMLSGVRLFYESGRMDERLSLKAALLGNEMIDRVVSSYVRQQIQFLRRDGGVGSGESVDVAYAKKEAHSISTRVLPFLSSTSPLRELADFVQASR